MNNKLLFDFEELLDNEVKRVMEIILKMYDDGIEVNKNFDELVKSLIDKKFKHYFCDIQLRTYLFIPANLEPDQTNVKALVTRLEGTENHLKKYIKWCYDERDKDHYKAVKGISKDLIKYANLNSNTKKVITRNNDKVYEKVFSHSL